MADRAVFSKEERAEFVGKFIDIFTAHYDGIIHCGWDFKGTPTEQVMKEKLLCFNGSRTASFGEICDNSSRGGYNKTKLGGVTKWVEMKVDA